jgi:hypothetical protein
MRTRRELAQEVDVLYQRALALEEASNQRTGEHPSARRRTHLVTMLFPPASTPTTDAGAVD